MTVYTVPWFPALVDSDYPQMTTNTFHLMMMVAITAKKLGWLDPFDFGARIGLLFDVEGISPDAQIRLARGAIYAARHLRLIDECYGKVGPSETLMRTRPWWES